MYYQFYLLCTNKDYYYNKIQQHLNSLIPTGLKVTLGGGYRQTSKGYRQSSSSFVSSTRILSFVNTFSDILVELLKVIESAGMC